MYFISSKVDGSYNSEPKVCPLWKFKIIYQWKHTFFNERLLINIYLIKFTVIHIYNECLYYVYRSKKMNLFIIHNVDALNVVY